MGQNNNASQQPRILTLELINKGFKDLENYLIGKEKPKDWKSADDQGLTFLYNAFLVYEKLKPVYQDFIQFPWLREDTFILQYIYQDARGYILGNPSSDDELYSKLIGFLQEHPTFPEGELPAWVGQIANLSIEQLEFHGYVGNDGMDYLTAAVDTLYYIYKIQKNPLDMRLYLSGDEDLYPYGACDGEPRYNNIFIWIAAQRGITLSENAWESMDDWRYIYELK